jgi:hypothetical protein
MIIKRVLTSIALLFLVLALLGGCAPSDRSQADRLGACPAGQTCNVLQGFAGNAATLPDFGATISGGGRTGFPNRVTNALGTVGGGQGNIAGEAATVGGGSENAATYFRATVGGGSNNQATGPEATIGGGYKNVASERRATVAGGAVNLASGIDATVGGGSGNTADYNYTAVGGGTANTASSLASVVAGGDHNLADGAYGAVLGGVNNAARYFGGTVGGGGGNTVEGMYATVPGGFANEAAGDFSLAAGRNAQVGKSHPGVFLFADSNPFPFPSSAANEFAVRATGGVRFVTGVDGKGSPLAGVRLLPGSGAWESLSDRNAKAAILPIDGRDVLDHLMQIPISTWRYRGQSPDVRHIGPMAQDFHAAFGVGEDGRYISTLDADGVALASVQGLYQIVQEQDRRIKNMQTRINVLEALLYTLMVHNRVSTQGWPVFAGLALVALAIWKRRG